MLHERNRTNFSHQKNQQELGLQFRPVEETLRNTFGWYQKQVG
jgi:hypothetical protein